jgi:hypothetical protein
MKESNVKVDEIESLSIVKTVSDADVSIRREKIESLELAMLQCDQVEIPVEHMFHGDIYARKIMIPKGTLLTGRIHLFDHFDIMISGDITVSTDSGEPKRLTGFNLMKGDKGKKRAGFAHEDTHWVTFHSAEERDPEEMYEFLTCSSFEEFEIFKSRFDYHNILNELGVSEESVLEVVKNTSDFDEEYKDSDCYISNSKISGKGFFAGSNKSKNQIISKARIGNTRTIAGRFTNHSPENNAKMVLEKDGSIDLIAIKEISKNEEITIDYKETIQYREKVGDLCQQ